ncbi:hypothetical protein IGI04_034747 [Brassica rapa subsp. trilocularis]|uniref:Uncharacterized protein n=1 Tax=Brassica rapa subsp. trilocularis TaxID=1813537 RepID=A0ABQ7LAN6_BRACM|nr:hypothetical protein IGI04_034747 [Brassica rapa subsp. trilocularis]
MDSTSATRRRINAIHSHLVTSSRFSPLLLSSNPTAGDSVSMVLQEDCVAELNNYIDPLYRVHTAFCFRSNATSGSNQPALPLVITNPECIDFVLIRGLLPKSRFRFKFGTMQAVTVIYYITQYSGVRKLETVTVAEVNAYVLNSPLRRFTDLKGQPVRKTNKKGLKSLVFFMKHCHETTLS